MPTRGSFTLEVRITGICLFVPESAGTPQVTVLMPQTIHVPHRTVLIHDRKFAASACDEDKDNWCLHELDGFELMLSNGSVPHVAIPGVYELNRPRLNRKADPKAGPAQGVAAKVILQSGYCEHVPPGARFRVDGAATRMAYEVQWVIPDMTNSTLILTDLNSSSAGKSIALHAHEGDRVVLYVRCVPQGEVWPDSPYPMPNKNTLVHHFSEIDKLLVAGHDQIDPPNWEDNPGDKPFGRSSDVVGPAAVTGNPYTCMPGQAPAGP